MLLVIPEPLTEVGKKYFFLFSADHILVN